MATETPTKIHEIKIMIPLATRQFSFALRGYGILVLGGGVHLSIGTKSQGSKAKVTVTKTLNKNITNY
jgi:hypothetical protein